VKLEPPYDFERPAEGEREQPAPFNAALELVRAASEALERMRAVLGPHHSETRRCEALTAEKRLAINLSGTVTEEALTAELDTSKIEAPRAAAPGQAAPLSRRFAD
jgi:hypothetical protein